MTPAVAWVLSAMFAFARPAPYQREAYVAIASAIVASTDDEESWIELASIGGYESGYAIHAWSRDGRGCYGVWQLCAPVPKALPQQAREALRRWREQGRCGYTGEANRRDGRCPLADERYLRARLWLYEHPFTREEPAS
jgi:hypothetical protein